MARPSPALLSLLLPLLLIADRAEAGPEIDLRPAGVQSSICQGHDALHDKLDKVEKRVEETMEKLEAEVALLLDAIEAPERRPIPDPDGPAVDILDARDESTVS